MIVTLYLYRCPGDDNRLLLNPREIVSVRRALDPEYTKPTDPKDFDTPWFNAELTEVMLKNGCTFLVLESIDDLFEALKEVA